MDQAFFISRYLAFPEGGSPQALFRDTCNALGIWPVYYHARRSFLSSPSLNGLESDLHKSKSIVAYFGDPASISNPGDDHALTVAQEAYQLGVPVLVCASQLYPTSVFTTHGIVPVPSPVDGAAEFKRLLTEHLQLLISRPQ